MTEKEALQWLARAVPCPVGMMSSTEAWYHGCNGKYDIENDKIGILPDEYDPAFFSTLPWLAVLTHEAVHATMFYVGRGLEQQAWINSALYDRGTFIHAMEREEAVAYLATAVLADELGFDGVGAFVKFEEYLGDAPEEVRDWVRTEAARAVNWLKERANALDKRPFDDDLRAWAEQA